MNNEDQIRQQIISSKDFRRSLTRQSFYWFFPTYFRHYMYCESAPFHKEMFMLLQDPAVLNLAITAFRGSAKSTIVTLAYVIWSMIGAPQKKYMLVISQTQELAKQILTNIKAELEENELLIHDFGPFTEVADEWRSNSIVNSQYGCRISAISQSEGVRGLRHRQYRPDLIIVDDVENLESVRTLEGRDRIWNWLTSEVIPLGAANTKMVFVGNLLHEDSLMMRLRQHIVTNKMTGVYREYPLIDGEKNILWPGLYPNMQAVETKRRSIADESAWHREYLLKIIADEDRIIKRSWIKYYDTLPGRDNFPARLLWVGVDLAISQSRNANFTALVPVYVVGFGDDLAIYVLPFIINKRLDFPETIKTLRSLTETLRVQYHSYPQVFVESVGYQGAVAQQLKVERVPAEEVKIATDKRSRLSVVSPYVRTGKVLFPRSGAEVLIDQLVNFGIEKYDDLVDAFTLVISKVIESDRPTSKPPPDNIAEPDPHPGLTWMKDNMTPWGTYSEPLRLDMKF